MGLLDMVKAQGGLLGPVGGAIGGPNDPRLNEAQNKQAQRDAILSAGLSMIMGGGPHPQGTQGFLQPIAEGLIAGRNTGAASRQNIFEAQQQADALSRQQKLQALIGQATQNGQLDVPAVHKLFMNALATGNVEYAKELSDVLNTMRNNQYMNVPSGGSVIDPNTGQEVYNQGVQLPGEMQNVMWSLGIDPKTATPQQRQAAMALYERLKAASAIKVQLNPEQKTTNADLGMGLKQWEDIDAGAVEAEGRLNSLDIMEGLLNQGMQTGKLDVMTQSWRELGASLGLGDTSNLSMQQAFRSVANKLALELKRSGGTNQMAGSMTDKDIQFLVEQAPQLANTPEGNRMLIGIMRQLANNQLLLAEEADRYVQENKSMLGWREHRRKWVANHRISLDDIMKNNGTMSDRFRAILRGR